jgi:hypothetical protein
MKKEKSADDAEDRIEVKPNMSTSPAREGSANAGSSNGNLDEKPRLSEHEKKANHIASGSYGSVQQLFDLPRWRLMFAEQNKSAVKQSAKASIASPNSYRGWRDKEEARAWC